MKTVSAIKTAIYTGILGLGLLGSPARADEAKPRTPEIRLNTTAGLSYTDIESRTVDTRLVESHIVGEIKLTDDCSLLLDASVFDIDKEVKRTPQFDRHYQAVQVGFGPKIKLGDSLTVIPRYAFLSDVDHLNAGDVRVRRERAHGFDIDTYVSLPENVELTANARALFASDGEEILSFSGGLTKHFDWGFVLARYVHIRDSFSDQEWHIGEGRIRYMLHPEKGLFLQVGGTVGDQNSGYGTLAIRPFKQEGANPLGELELSVTGRYLRDEKTNSKWNTVGIDMKLEF